MRLTNTKGKIIKSRVYVTEGEEESLLGKEDAKRLGILKLDPEGEDPEDEVNRLKTVMPEVLRCITPEILQDEKTKGVVSGGKTQAEIDKDMEAIAAKYAGVFEGMGRAKVDPINIQIQDDAVPIAQGKQPIPIQFQDAVRKKLQYMVENDLIEGPLPAKECKGRIHNMVITKKNWSTEEVRINIDTKRMNKYLVQTKIPIPTTETLRHNLEGSDKFTALDCRDSFFHFGLDEPSQDLFKFHGEDGVYWFKVLVMGTHSASGESHAAMSRILSGLKGVIVIKDDILVHGVGKEHNENLEACLQRLHNYGIHLRREKCKMRQQAVMWLLQARDVGGPSQGGTREGLAGAAGQKRGEIVPSDRTVRRPIHAIRGRQTIFGRNSTPERANKAERPLQMDISVPESVPGT